MAKNHRPGEKVASLNICADDSTREYMTKPVIEHPKRTPKKHRARVYMLRTGIEGWTENDILKYCRLSSGRNYATELIRLLDINLERIQERNPDGIGSHLRYRFTHRADVLRVIKLINNNAAAGGYGGLSQQAIADILTLYPDTFTTD